MNSSFIFAIHLCRTQNYYSLESLPIISLFLPNNEAEKHNPISGTIAVSTAKIDAASVQAQSERSHVIMQIREAEQDSERSPALSSVMSAVETMPVPAAAFTLRRYYLQLTLIPSHFLTAPLCGGNETKRNIGTTHLVNKSFSDKCTYNL